MHMRKLFIACAIGLTLGTASCNGTLGVPTNVVTQAENVQIPVTQGLTIAWSTYNWLTLAIEREVQAPNSWVRGDIARRIRIGMQATLDALNAADAARTAGNNALMRVKTNDAIGLISGLVHDFPQLAGAVSQAAATHQ